MPITELHKERRKKNFLTLAIIVAWIVLLFVVAVLKIKAGHYDGQ
jgi:hypothetical protein